jgi:hypothetical protein
MRRSMDLNATPAGVMVFVRKRLVPRSLAAFVPTSHEAELLTDCQQIRKLTVRNEMVSKGNGRGKWYRRKQGERFLGGVNEFVIILNSSPRGPPEIKL